MCDTDDNAVQTILTHSLCIVCSLLNLSDGFFILSAALLMFSVERVCLNVCCPDKYCTVSQKRPTKFSVHNCSKCRPIVKMWW